jgi:prepilin peptidase CpaA
MPLLTYLILTAFVVACCVVDVRTRRIPNAISGPAVVAGVILNTISYGLPGLGWSLAGVGIMVAILLAPFALGGLGGGDVKMMAAVGAFLGPRLALYGLLVGMVLGGIVMVIHLVRIGRLTEKVASLRTMVVNAALLRSVDPLRMAANDPVVVSLPYSVPLGLGAAIVVAASLWR